MNVTHLKKRLDAIEQKLNPGGHPDPLPGETYCCWVLRTAPLGLLHSIKAVNGYQPPDPGDILNPTTTLEEQHYAEIRTGTG